jgi:hypothetical protein
VSRLLAVKAGADDASFSIMHELPAQFHTVRTPKGSAWWVSSKQFVATLPSPATVVLHMVCHADGVLPEGH